jgi:hypothetical protein
VPILLSLYIVVAFVGGGLSVADGGVWYDARATLEVVGTLLFAACV